MVIGVSFPGVLCGRGVTLTTHPHLVPRSWMSRSYTSSPPLPIHWCAVGLLFAIIANSWPWSELVHSLPAEREPAGYRYSNLLGECQWIAHSDARATLTQSISSFRRETECGGEVMTDCPAALHACPFHCPTQVSAHSYLFTWQQRTFEEMSENCAPRKHSWQQCLW
jgi:hypothetical protein